MDYGKVLFPSKKDSYRQNLLEIEDLLKRIFDLERLLIEEDSLTEFTIFKFRFNKNKSVGCIVDKSHIKSRIPKDTAQFIAYLVIDELFRNKCD